MDDNSLGRPFAELLDRVKAGDNDAAQTVWKLYQPAVIRLLRQKLPAHRRREFDEEDVAASAFLSFFDGLAASRFRDLDGPDNLWNLLAVIAGRKAQAYLKRQSRRKRGDGRVRGESVFEDGNDARRGGINQIGDPSPSAAVVSDFVDEVQDLLNHLERDDLQKVALLKLEGCTVAELARELQMTQRAVQRRLAVIRQIWRERLDAFEASG